MKFLFSILLLFFIKLSVLGQELPVQVRNAMILDRSGHYENADQLLNIYYNKVFKENNFGAMVQTLTVRSWLCTSNDSLFKAIDYSNKASEIARKTDDPIQKLYANSAKNWIDFFTNNNKNVVTNCKEALKMIPAKQHIVLRIMLNSAIYNVYSQMNNWNEAKPYIDTLTQLEKETNKINYKFSAGYYLSNYLTWKYANKPNKLLKDSILNLYEILHIKFQQGYLPVTNFVVTLFNETKFKGELFPNNDAEQLKIYKVGEDSVQKYLPIIRAKRLFFLALNYTYLAQIQLLNNSIDSANYYLKLGNDTLKEVNLSASNLKFQILNSLVTLSEMNKDYKSAFNYEKDARIYSEKLYEAETNVFNKKIEAQFQLGEKNIEIANLKAKEDWQRKLNFIYLGLIILGTAAFIGYYKSYKFKLKYSSEKSQKLRLERDEAKLLYQLNIGEQNRLQREKEYLDMQHEQMKRELMLNTLHLEHKNNLLQNISESAKDGNPINLQRILKDESNIDMDFEEVKTQIQDIHPSFFNALLDKSQQKLTSLDLKYCAYLHLNIETKQIAQLLNVEPKSVRMSKYRIKQKLGLEKEEDLEIYLKDIK